MKGTFDPNVAALNYILRNGRMSVVLGREIAVEDLIIHQGDSKSICYPNVTTDFTVNHSELICVCNSNPCRDAGKDQVSRA